MLSLLTRSVAFIAFVVLGIVWSSERTDGLALAWAASFVVVAALAVWSDLEPRMRPTLSGVWDGLGGPSKDPADYR